MRIIHDIRGPCRPMVGSRPYTRQVDRDKASDWKADITITSRDCLTSEEDKIHIEGSARYVIPMFERTLEMLKAVHEDYLKRGLVEDYRRAGIGDEDTEDNGDSETPREG